MKKLKVLVWSMCLVLGACAVKPTTEVYTSERGTQWEWNKGTIVVHTPERPAGQKSVLGLTVPKMDVVRVGFVGLGMRGPGAVDVLHIFPVLRLLPYVIMNRNVQKIARNT